MLIESFMIYHPNRVALLSGSNSHLAIMKSIKPTKQWVFCMFECENTENNQRVMSK